MPDMPNRPNYDYIVPFILLIIAIKLRMEVLAIVTILIFLVGSKRIKDFIERIMSKIEKSKEGSIAGTTWKEYAEAISPADSNISEKESGISTLEFNKYFEQGNFALLRQGNVQKAREMFEKAEEIDPDDFQVHTTLGLIHNMLGENKKSIEHSKKALTLKPGSFTPQFNLAVATNHYLGSEKSLPEYKKAEEIVMEENIGETVTVGKLNLFIGHDYREAGDIIEAKQRYENAKNIFKLYDTAEARFWLNDTIKNIKQLDS